VAITIV